jgi:hypothetical protein
MNIQYWGGAEVLEWSLCLSSRAPLTLDGLVFQYNQYALVAFSRSGTPPPSPNHWKLEAC